MPGFRPSQPPHSRQMDSSLEISEVAFPCIIVLRWRKTLSRGWRPNSKSWLRTHARRIDRRRAHPHTPRIWRKRLVLPFRARGRRDNNSHRCGTSTRVQKCSTCPQVQVRPMSNESLVLCDLHKACLLYTSPSPRDGLLSRMPSSA